MANTGTGILLGNSKEGHHLQDLGLNGRIISEWILKELGGMTTVFIRISRDKGKLL